MTKERYHNPDLEHSNYFDLDRAMRRFRQNCKELLGEFEIPAELEPYIEAYNRETVAKGGTPWEKL
jgi:hypothetical protein